MHREAKTFIGLTVLRYLLYCSGLELNPAKSQRCVGVEHLLSASLCSRHWDTERNNQHRPLFSWSLHWGGGGDTKQQINDEIFRIAINVTWPQNPVRERETLNLREVKVLLRGH